MIGLNWDLELSFRFDLTLKIRKLGKDLIKSDIRVQISFFLIESLIS
jgi:hypothetical protein